MAARRRAAGLRRAGPRQLHEDRSGLVVLGFGCADRQPRRPRRGVARRPAALPVRPLRLVAGRRRHRDHRQRLPAHQRAGTRERPPAALRLARLRARAAVVLRDRGDQALATAGGAAGRAGRRDRRPARHGARPRPRLQRRDARAARDLRGRVLAVHGPVVAPADGAHRHRHRAGAGVVQGTARGARGPAHRRAIAAGTRRDGGAHARGRGGSRADRRRAAGPVGAEVRARHQGEAAAALRRHARFALAAAVAPRGRAACLGNGERRNARVHLAADRAQARRLRRAGEGPRGVSGTGDHPLRDRARGRRQGRADRQPRQGPRAGPVGGEHSRRRDDSRQVVHGAGAAEPAAPDRQAGGDPVVGDLQRRREPDHDRARQGHRRTSGDHRPREDAAPAGRGHHGVRQVGRGQRDDPVAALQVRAAPGPPDPRRPEDARAVGLRRHPASARAGGHRHEARAQRAQLVRGRDGAALPGDEPARRAQPLRLQREDRRRQEGGEAAPSTPSR